MVVKCWLPLLRLYEELEAAQAARLSANDEQQRHIADQHIATVLQQIGDRRLPFQPSVLHKDLGQSVMDLYVLQIVIVDVIGYFVHTRQSVLRMTRTWLMRNVL